MDRINLLASLTKDANSIVDVGCDHGYVAIKSIKEYGVNHAYLLDINEAPLLNAKKNVSEALIEDKAEFILSNGLLKFEGETDTLVIAGMGGLLIADILKSSIVKAREFKKIILGPHNDIDKLRGFLITNSFNFDDEFIIKDGKKIYEIIVCHYEKDIKSKYSLLDMKFGPILRKKNDQLFNEVIDNKQKLLNECLKKAQDSDNKSKIKVELAMISLLKGNKNG